MPEPIRISAKDLGGLALPDFCPRCFWVQRRAERLPYQIFPGIFSSIDSYSKRLVHSWFDRHGGPPPWLAPLGEIIGYIPPPHHSKFQTLDKKSAVLLTGSPDGVLVKRDASRVIIDYKTARFTEYQDALFPMYEVQLNAYAYIGERCGLAPISGLALVYTEPITDDAAARAAANTTDDGFLLKFGAKVLPVRLAPQSLPPLLRRVRAIHDLKHPPDGLPGCEDCAALGDLLSVLKA